MFPAYNGLSQKLNTAFKENWSPACSDVINQLAASESYNENEVLNGRSIHLKNVNSVTLNKMKERIDALESVNDQLYHYIYFLIEHLPELILKTIYSDLESNHLIQKKYAANRLNEFDGPTCNYDTVCPLPTRREKDVLQLLKKGFCAKEIAKLLFISETTVISHKKNLKKKFKAKNTVELISKVSINL